MAKLKGPLFSMGASGAIGKILVYFPWKGIDAVREYVVPSNPQTTEQTTQRDYLKAAVAAIHTAQALAAHPLDEDDQTACSTLASAKGVIMTWFNQITKLWLKVKVAAKVPCIYTDGRTDDPTTTAITVEVTLNPETGGSPAAGKFYFGRSKTNLVNAVAAVVGAGVTAYLSAVDCSAFLTAGIKYFWQFRPDSGDDSVGADSGIYHFVAE